MLWIELLMREAAVYVIVLMLPLAFAAMVWPARRIWAIRAVELLVALILSKFAIVAVLSLGGAAISAGAAGGSITGVMAGAVLIMLAAFSPWALLRLIPLTELASGAAGTLRAELRSAGGAGDAASRSAEDWSATAAAAMRRAVEGRWQDTARLPGATPATPTTHSLHPRTTTVAAQRDGGDAPDGGRPAATHPTAAAPADAPDGGGPTRTAADPPERADPPDAGDAPATTPDALDWARRPALELDAAEPARHARLAQPRRGRSMTGERLSYRFGPLERRGIFGQVRGGQAAAVATGALRRDRRARPGARRPPARSSGRCSSPARCSSRSRRSAAAPPRSGLRSSSRSGSGSRGAGSASARAPRPAGCSPPSAPVRCAACSGIRIPTLPPRSRGVRIVDAPYRDRPIGVTLPSSEGAG